MAVTHMTMVLDGDHYDFWEDLPEPELNLTDQNISFGEREEVGVGMLFPIHQDGMLFGKGYFQLIQQPKKQSPVYHVPVLLGEVVRWLITERGGVYLDCTVGGGAHSEALLEQLSPEGKVIGLDLDAEALEHASERLRRFGPRVTLRQANFRELGAVLQELKIPAVDGILMDLGVSSHQIDTDYRGFSFMQAGPLDMRMNRRQRFGAYQVVNTYPESELRRIFYEYGEERRSAAIARAIVKARQQAKIDSTDRLAKIIAGAVPRQHLNKTLARIFQAIRIEVNAELTNLQAGLEQAVEYLRPGGRLVVISYHSLEDRIVKHFFRENERHCICPPELPQCVCGEPGRLRVLTRRPVVPSEEEIRRNPRARSAKLRVAEKLEEADSGQRD